VLERVTVGQTRFAMPGISADARGVALGKLGVLQFPAIDGVVRWLRLYADEDSLDELLPATQIVRAISPLKTRSFLLVVPVSSTYVLDRAARCARLAGGAVFTGTSRHFVAYRDERSPYGYDTIDLGSPPAGAEYVLHGDAATQTLGRDGAVDVGGLIFRLSLRRVPGAERLDAEGRAQLYVTVAEGLASGLIRYLLRYHVRAEVTKLHFADKSAFAAPGEPDSYLLLRVHQLPERVLAGLRGVPGVTVLAPVGDNIAVEVGYAHPIALTSASSLFPKDRFHLFLGGADRLDVVKGPLELASAEHLGGGLRLRSAPARAASSGPADLGTVGVELRLVPTLSPRRRVVGAWVEWSEAARLKKLIYALPPALLAGHQVAVTQGGVLLLATGGVDVIPLGTLLGEIAPRLLVPVGMDLIPRVPTDLLIAAIEHATGAAKPDLAKSITVFTHRAPPFFVAEAALVPLERGVVARIQVTDVGAAPPERGPTPEPARIVNDKVGRFALWGFQGEGS
jgi:hypothetical protein